MSICPHGRVACHCPICSDIVEKQQLQIQGLERKLQELANTVDQLRRNLSSTMHDHRTID